MTILEDGVIQISITEKKKIFVKLFPLTKKKTKEINVPKEKKTHSSTMYNFFMLFEIFLLNERKKLVEYSLSNNSKKKTTFLNLQKESFVLFNSLILFLHLRLKIQKKLMSLVSNIPGFSFECKFLSITSCQWIIKFKNWFFFNLF